MLHGFEAVRRKLLYLWHDVPLEVNIDMAEMGAQVDLEIREFYFVSFFQAAIVS